MVFLKTIMFSCGLPSGTIPAAPARQSRNKNNGNQRPWALWNKTLYSQLENAALPRKPGIYLDSGVESSSARYFSTVSTGSKDCGPTINFEKERTL